MAFVEEVSSPLRYPNLDGSNIAKSLQGKDIGITIYGVKHSGLISAELIRAYGNADLRTIEALSGSTTLYSVPFSWLTTQFMLGIGALHHQYTLAGLAPEYPILTTKRNTASVSGDLYDYARPLYEQFNDIRGVDHSRNNANLIAHIFQDKVSINEIETSGLEENVRLEISKNILANILAAKRDNVQAYWISKILSLYTCDKASATLVHLGGAAHVSLPEILKRSYGLNASVDTTFLEDLKSIKTLEMAQLVMSAIPLELALAIPVTLNEENVEFDYSKVIPHLDSIMNDIVDRAKQLIELEKEEPDNSVL